MTAVDVDSLPPLQRVMLDVLAARYRTGEQLWTFPTQPATVRAAHQLARLGLVGVQSGVAAKTIQVWLTEAGEAAVLKPGWVNPADQARRTAVTILRHFTAHVDGRTLLWPAGLGEEPGWFAGHAILADPVLSARYGLNDERGTP